MFDSAYCSTTAPLTSIIPNAEDSYLPTFLRSFAALRMTGGSWSCYVNRVALTKQPQQAASRFTFHVSEPSQNLVSAS